MIVFGLIVAAEIALQAFLSASWAKERQILLERIQAPERVSIASQSPEKEPLETDEGEMALVGRIDYGAPDG